MAPPAWRMSGAAQALSAALLPAHLAAWAVAPPDGQRGGPWDPESACRTVPPNFVALGTGARGSGTDVPWSGLAPLQQLPGEGPLADRSAAAAEWRADVTNAISGPPAPEAVQVGQYYLFIRSTGYFYSAGCVDGQAVRVLQVARDAGHAPAVQVRWDATGHVARVQYADLRTLVSPERARFSALGPGGPPTSADRRLAWELSAGLACEACQQVLTWMWHELVLPTPSAIDGWLAEGCVSSVRRVLLEKGWQITTGGCGGVGFTSRSGEVWCLLQDRGAPVVSRPELSQEYEPAKDALFLACERTLGANPDRVSAYLTESRNGTEADGQAGELLGLACAEAACCRR